MAGNEICWTVKLDEDDWKAIERAIMSIEKRLERVEAILDARGLDWDHPRVASDHFVGASKMVADEPPKKWRILEPGEMVQEGDLTNAKSNPPSDPPNGSGWIPVIASVGDSVCENDPCIFARPVAEPPAKEPAEPEYREPVLPADYKMACEFSDNGSSWASGRLCGWRVGSNWISTGGVCWRHCRIKKDA